MKKQVSLILHNIRSAYNVGAIFRTADACGIKMISLTGYTPAPVDEFGRANSGIAKSAIGAEKTVAWKKVKNINAVLTKLKKGGAQIIAIEQDKNSTDYKKVKPKYPCAFILGEEVNGLTKSILDKCDVVAEIPMNGQKESLNVSVAAGIALFRILNV
ncbi:MAG: TrmH family RNA methyltransferase [Patescibacteria group bacterium]|mgnify:CR=1 FL=1